MDCIFCQIVKKKAPAKILYEDDDVMAFLDIKPSSEGHTLVIPKKHYPDFLSTPPQLVAKVAIIKQQVAKMLVEKLQPLGFNFISNQGAEAFQVVFHYHEHIVLKFSREFGYVRHVVYDEHDRTPDVIFNNLELQRKK